MSILLGSIAAVTAASRLRKRGGTPSPRGNFYVLGCDVLGAEVAEYKRPDQWTPYWTSVAGGLTVVALIAAAKYVERKV